MRIAVVCAPEKIQGFRQFKQSGSKESSNEFVLSVQCLLLILSKL